MKTSKKTIGTSGPSKLKKNTSIEDQEDFIDPKEHTGIIPEDEDDFDIPLDDDIKNFDEFDEFDDEDDF